MNTITYFTRNKSYEETKPTQIKRRMQILDRLMTGRKTAKEIAVEMYDLGLIPSTERNYTAPRLSDMAEEGLVITEEKKKCDYTGKTVAIYEITPKGIEYRYSNHIPRID